MNHVYSKKLKPISPLILRFRLCRHRCWLESWRFRERCNVSKRSYCYFRGIQRFISAKYLFGRRTESPEIFGFKEARNRFFGLGVYLLKSKFRIEDKLRFPWYYTTFSTNDQSLFSHWFPSNSCHHSNGNGQPLILNNVEYLEN